MKRNKMDSLNIDWLSLYQFKIQGEMDLCSSHLKKSKKSLQILFS